MTDVAQKVYNHFRHQDGVFRVLGDIKARFEYTYSDLAARLCNEIGKYYGQIPEAWDEHGKKVKSKLLLGLSGGVDSSLVAYLAVRAVGAENVLPITMPARKDDECVRFSNLVREELGIKVKSVQFVIPILEIVRQEIETINSLKWKGIAINLSRESQTDMDRMRIGNFASRARVAILYDIARKVNGKILGTGNRTEFVQGYAAKYGTPISFDFGILDELYKADIYELARVLNLPEEIIEGTPSTGYFPGQTHEKELGATWEEQDALAFLLFEKKATMEEVLRDYEANKEFVETMLRRHERSKEKRMLKQPHIKLGFIDDGDIQ
jgi:NAD+ synthase